ncbi:unnamed protein product [Thelazia callipaeda]|uniref:phosphoinositide 5-phosphatase n=1 Tax=Thelazia callipaeda TaxID=103827 RepID=A0A0N5CZL4_THECL|nr:unnamed protein product [Thelazia callipaeda]
MSHRSAIRIAYRDVSTEPYSVIVDSQRTGKILLFQSSAVTTISDRESVSALRKNHAKLMDARGLVGVLRSGQDDAYLIAVTEDENVGELRSCKIYRIWSVNVISLKVTTPVNSTDTKINDLLRLFSSGNFYYASQDDSSRFVDLTIRSHKSINSLDGDKKIYRNKHLHFPLKRYGVDANEWLLRIICGAVVICQVYVGQVRATVALISRLSCERVGTRFNVRGVNDDGHVANFVETEQIIALGPDETSFVQIRGSVPLFWEQPGINVGSHKVKLRAFEASSPAFIRHFRFLKDEYGEITIVNLLGSKEGEILLSRAYEAHYKNSNCCTDYITFDYHEEKRNCWKLLERLNSTITKCMFYQQRNGNAVVNQIGAIRVNCLDCLDRTNAVQTLIGLQVLISQLKNLGVDKKYFSRFEERLKEIWQRNGDSCSVIYAGTGALEGKSKMKDARRTLVRTIQNNFLDAAKQEAFEFLLNESSVYDPLYSELTSMVPRHILQECPLIVKDLMKRKEEMIDMVPLILWAGTWNVNGGKNFSDTSFRNQTNLAEWLFPEKFFGDTLGENIALPDIYVVGLEEIIDLNATNIVNASTTNQRAWARGLRETLLKRNKYVLLGCEQLVGVCVFVFIRPSLAAAIRDMSISSVKTGMGGTTGNKGSIAVSLTIYSTTFCFVCSHLAAGQNEVRDRNEDYMSALKKIRFPQGRSILSHVVVFWMGDFNYRINLSRDEAEAAIKTGNMMELFRYDQLSQQKALGEVFKNFKEGPLIFAPTYKYDTLSDEYDSSEKCRIPAWTDRILWKEADDSKVVRLLGYDRIELRTSDHRPVCALFLVDAYKINLTQFGLVFKDVLSSMGPPDATVLVSVCGCENFPAEFRVSVIEKLDQLGISPSISKIESGMLWLIFNSCDMALAALSLDGVKIGNHSLTVQLLSPDWAEVEYAELIKMLRNVKEDISVEFIEFRNADNFEISDGDDVLIKNESDVHQLPKQRSASLNRRDKDLTLPSLPNATFTSVSSPLPNDNQIYGPLNDIMLINSISPALPRVRQLPRSEEFNLMCIPPPIPPRKDSVRK